MALGFHAIGKRHIFWLDRVLFVLFAGALIATALIASMPARAISGSADVNQAGAHAAAIDLQ